MFARCENEMEGHDYNVNRTVNVFIESKDNIKCKQSGRDQTGMKGGNRGTAK